jgi:hypothetical protein
MGTDIAPAGTKYEEDVDMEKVLFSPEALNLRISELGRQISTDFAGKPVVLLGVCSFSTSALHRLCVSSEPAMTWRNSLFKTWAGTLLEGTDVNLSSRSLVRNIFRGQRWAQRVAWFD